MKRGDAVIGAFALQRRAGALLERRWFEHEAGAQLSRSPQAQARVGIAHTRNGRVKADLVALWHDVLITVGAFSILQYDFDINVLGALLTIIGYSVNDTVVIYDRIRENLRKFKKMPIEELIDLSINEMLSRTIMVSATVFIALLALFFFGPAVIHSFTFAMLFGVVIGTYSSIFIAAPILVYFGVKRDWSGVTPGSTRTKESAAS